MGLVTIGNRYVCVTISTVGAELQSIVDAEGVERLWQGYPAYWAGRAPILFPVAGGFRGDGYVWEGTRYPMPKHGFVRKLPWRVLEAGDTRATLAIDTKDVGFPFDYELRAVFSLADAALTVRYEVENRGDSAFYYSVGAHEGYTTPEGLEHYELVFDEAETFVHSILDGNLIRHETVEIAAGTRVLPLKYDYFTVDALVLRSLRSRGVTLRSALHGREIRVEYPGHDVLMLWTRPGAGYLCIEPWCNAPDFVDADECIDRKPGFMRLNGGETQAHEHIIRVK